MVLEEASSGSEPSSFTEDPPSSDIDPYASSNTTYLEGRASSYVRINNGSQQPIYINTANLPQMFGFFRSPNYGPGLSKALQDACQQASTVLGRPVRQEEADALAFHYAKAVRYFSFGAPVGMSLGLIQAYRTRANLRFPGWTPIKEGSRFSPDRFGPLRGRYAMATWTLARLMAYTFVGNVLGLSFFGFYATSVGSVGRMTDPRLKDFIEAVKKRQKEGLGLPNQASDTSDGRRQGQETFEMARQRRAGQMQQARQMQGQSGSREKNDGDDMSPTGGAFNEDFMSVGSDSGMMSDGQAREQQQRADNATTTFDMSRTSSTQSASESATQPRSGSSQQSGQQPNQASGGSAWDRLRQTAMSGNQSSSSQSSSGSRYSSTSSRSSAPSNAAASDSFSFSNSEEDKQLARAEAQKEFDARLERERHGQNFEEGGGSSDRKGR